MKERFDGNQLAEIRRLSYRQANEKFGIGFTTWSRIRRDANFVPKTSRRGDREIAEVMDRVLQSVREVPHINTAARAKSLGLRVEVVQRVLAQAGLSNLNARLQHAGYKVDVLRPLQVARLRRIVASHPGSITHIDYKTFGFLRGIGDQKGIRLGGYVCCDSLTAFATVYLSSTTGGEAAWNAIEKHRKTAPFELRGIIFSDNGPTDFLSDYFIEQVARAGLIQRTTRYNSPWSNGKAEALNKTLKYQCFPAIAAANVTQWDQVEELVDQWLHYYNHVRAHTGHVNRGLPPVAWYNLWKATPGDEVEKLAKLGVLPLDNQWVVSMMGGSHGSAGEQPWGPNGRGQPDRVRGLPFAFVLDRKTPAFIPNEGPELPRCVAQKLPEARENAITLAK